MRTGVGHKKQPPEMSISRGRNPPIDKGGLSLLEPHVVFDVRHSVDAARHLDRFVYIGLGAHKTAQLNCALEGFNVDFGGFQGGLVEYRRLHLGRDNTVVDVFPSAFLLRRGRATHRRHQQHGEEKRGNVFKLFHGGILYVYMNAPNSS